MSMKSNVAESLMSSIISTHKCVFLPNFSSILCDSKCIVIQCSCFDSCVFSVCRDTTDELR